MANVRHESLLQTNRQAAPVGVLARDASGLAAATSSGPTSGYIGSPREGNAPTGTLPRAAPMNTRREGVDTRGGKLGWDAMKRSENEGAGIARTKVRTRGPCPSPAT